jgi:hypothetical protein
MIPTETVPNLILEAVLGLLDLVLMLICDGI